MDKVAILRSAFKSGVLKTVASRKQYLLKFFKFVEDHEEQIGKALKEDLNKVSYESYLTEISTVKSEITHLHSNLYTWTADEHVSKSFIFMMDSAHVQCQPYGVVLIIGAWNYPIQLTLSVVAGAIAAGNTVLLKPSEMAPATEKFLVENLTKAIGDICQVFSGGPQDTQTLLKENRFDFILYTGSSRVGRIVMAEAAKFLTPVCLELGGKSPVYIDKDVNLELAAKRVTWAKLLNSGQICIAPDYILCHESVYEDFVEAVKRYAIQFFGKNPIKSPDYCRIINKEHTQRLADVIKRSKGEVVLGGADLVELEQRFVPPTIIRNVKPGDSTMEDELFGPIMPILKVNSCDEALDMVNGGEKPLAIYVFTSNNGIFEAWHEGTSSGGLCHNECIMHFAHPNLPFGGVGNSGIGAYHGKYSIDTFSHKRAVLLKTTNQSTDFVRYPPYNTSSESWGRWFTKSKPSQGYCCIM